VCGPPTTLTTSPTSSHQLLTSPPTIFFSGTHQTESWRLGFPFGPNPPLASFMNEPRSHPLICPICPLARHLLTSPRRRRLTRHARNQAPVARFWVFGPNPSLTSRFRMHCVAATTISFAPPPAISLCCRLHGVPETEPLWLGFCVLCFAPLVLFLFYF
jgi:hypothetical protein